MRFFSDRPVLTAMAGLVFAVLFWAINTVVAKSVVSNVPPMALSLYRWLTAFVFLLPFAVGPMIRDRKVIRENLGVLFLLSIPSVAIYNSVLYLGALYTTATNISLVVAAMPAMALLLTWVVNHDRPRPLQVLGIGISLSGVMTIISQGAWQTVADLHANPGDVLILLSIASWALYSVLLKKKPLPLSPLSFLMVTIVFGFLTIFPFYLLELKLTHGFEVTANTIWMFAYLGLCPSILSYICWNHGVKVLGPSTSSVFVYLIPVFTAVMAYFFLGERFFTFHFWGGGLILAGLVLSSRTGANR